VDVAEPKDLAGKPVLDFVASDNTLDRYDEVIDAAGWKLDNYRLNPVFQNAHKYGDVIFTLGKSLMTSVQDGKLQQRIEFATDINPMAKITYGLYRGKFLNAVSVGFIPVKWENGIAPGTGGQPGTPWRRKYIEQELLELSAVAVPANPNALVMGLKSGAIERGDLSDLLELARMVMDKQGTDKTDKTDNGAGWGNLISEFCSDKANLGGHAGAPASEVHGAQLLQLVKSAEWVLQKA
jgi:hypothetical protein